MRIVWPVTLVLVGLFVCQLTYAVHIERERRKFLTCCISYNTLAECKEAW